MPILQDQDREHLQKRFDSELEGDVTLKLFTQPETGLYIPGRECHTCGPTQRLMEEVCTLSPRLKLEVLDFYKEREAAAEYGIDKVPALVIGGDGNRNVRYYGLPSGFEFSVLLEAIMSLSRGQGQLAPATRRQLETLAEDVHIQVFVTPTCHFCPAVARMAHAMAVESPRVRSDVIEVQEFPYLARQYGVMSVPKTVINDRVQFVGAVNEETFLKKVLDAVAVETTAVEGENVMGEVNPVAQE